MTLMDFCSLPQREKLELLYQNGVYIGKRKISDTTVLLYQIEGFYVELYYRRYRRFVDSIRCFAGTRRLDPYLEQIDLEHWV